MGADANTANNPGFDYNTYVPSGFRRQTYGSAQNPRYSDVKIGVTQNAVRSANSKAGRGAGTAPAGLGGGDSSSSSGFGGGAGVGQGQLQNASFGAGNGNNAALRLGAGTAGRSTASGNGRSVGNGNRVGSGTSGPATQFSQMGQQPQGRLVDDLSSYAQRQQPLQLASSGANTQRFNYSNTGDFGSFGGQFNGSNDSSAFGTPSSPLQLDQ